MCVCVCVCVIRGRVGVQSSTREALLGVEARGSPEGTARLEEPLAGQQLNKRWEGSVSLEGQEHWEAPCLNAEDKQMLAETEKMGGKRRRMTERKKKENIVVCLKIEHNSSLLIKTSIYWWRKYSDPVFIYTYIQVYIHRSSSIII